MARGKLVPSDRPPLSRPIGGGNRFPSPVSGEVRSESTEQARRRRQRARRDEIEERAHWLLEYDPDINTLAEARKAARQQSVEIEEHQAQAGKGLVDPLTGEPTREGRRRSTSTSNGSANGSRPSRGRARARGRMSSRPRRARGAVRKTARTVVAPFESTAAAGWTFFQAGLSLVLLFVVLRSADAIGAFVDGITAGIRRFGDPTVPLIPTRGESAPPPPRRRTVRQQP